MDRPTKTKGICRLFTTLIAGVLSGLILVAPAANADAASSWRKSVAKSFAKNHIYPRSAISKEIEGKARLQVVINRAGEVTGFEVLEPSGQTVLDKTLPRLIKKVSPLPAPPPNLPDENLTFVIPVTWQVN